MRGPLDRGHLKIPMSMARVSRWIGQAMRCRRRYPSRARRDRDSAHVAFQALRLRFAAPPGSTNDRE